MTEEQKPLKEIADELMKIKGNMRGDIFCTHATYIEYKKGPEGVKLVEEKLKELGYPVNFKKISRLKMYPSALSALIIFVTQNVFDWKDADIFDMGKSAPKCSLIVRLLTKYFISPKSGYEAAPKYWRQYYEFGEIEAPEFNEKEKYCIVRLKGYKTHPVVCIYFSGFFTTFGKMILRGIHIVVKEVKCVYKGDPYHEWIIRWE